MGCTIRTAKKPKSEPLEVVAWAHEHLSSTPKALGEWGHTRTEIYIALRNCLASEAARKSPRAIRLACLRVRIKLLSTSRIDAILPLLHVKESTLGQPDLLPGNFDLSGDVIGAIEKLAIPVEQLIPHTGGTKP